MTVGCLSGTDVAWPSSDKGTCGGDVAGIKGNSGVGAAGEE